jgi:hypothetical protein
MMGALRKSGWRVLVIWECAMKGPQRRDPEDLLGGTSSEPRLVDPMPWLIGAVFIEWSGKNPKRSFRHC